MDKSINIIALNIPYPPNYGGIIDIYYKIRALHDQGVGIILHCFQYDRPEAPRLEALCREVHYYQRATGLLPNLSFLPYNVYGRKSPDLLENLKKNPYPILFEGLHSCYYLDHPDLKGRFRIFRECNIEHDYYGNLARSESDLFKKAFFFLEGLRFRAYQKHLRSARLMLCVSQADTDYLQRIFPRNRIAFMPCFHANESITARTGHSDFILYHGKLSVVENEKAALFLIRNVFGKLPYPCVIAGMNPGKRIKKAAAGFPNIRIEADPSKERMDYLVREAQLNMLVTFQGTGLKLKLLNSLFAGRHVIVNSTMLNGTGLDALCHIADTPQEMLALCRKYMEIPFGQEEIEKRKRILFPAYANAEQAKRLIDMVWTEPENGTVRVPDRNRCLPKDDNAAGASA